MIKTKNLILGAGISGLSLAKFIKGNDYIILEKTNQIGGYCKTIKQKGFTWDYSGHFLHFKDQEMKEFVKTLIPSFLKIRKNTKIKFKNRYISYPFQANIRQ